MPGNFGGRGGRGGYGGRSNSDEIDVGKNVMRRMAHETGGSFFIVTEDRPIENAFGQIEEELRNQYSLGYTSDNTSVSQDFRRIDLETRRPGLIVHTRGGYYPGPGLERLDKTAKTKSCSNSFISIYNRPGRTVRHK